MKMIKSTSITSMNGVTLMSCDSGKSSSSASISPSDAAIVLLRGAQQRARRSLVERPVVEIARQQPPDRSRRAADQIEVAARAAIEEVVDHHGRDRRRET